LKVKNKRKKAGTEIDLMIAFFIVIFLIFLMYLLTSYIRYKALVEELNALKEAYEIEKKQLSEKEAMLQKLQKIIEDNQLKEDNKISNEKNYTPNASETR